MPNYRISLKFVPVQSSPQNTLFYHSETLKPTNWQHLLQRAPRHAESVSGPNQTMTTIR